MAKRLLFVLIFLLPFCSSVSYAADSSSVSKKTSTQQVGGLLFDVDEGAKIEQGPGGSVYVKSNREYMQQKFAEMENRLVDLEARTTELEDKLKSLGGSGKKTSAENPTQENAGRQVLIS